MKEKAENLGNGKWLFISATEHFDMYLSEMRDTNPLNRKRLDGCKACVIELECGTKVETRFIEIRADMVSCRNDSVMRVDVNLTEPLRYLFSKIPSLNEMPHIATESQARQQIIEKFQLKMTTNSYYYRKSFDRLNELTTPIVEDLKIIRPSLSCRFTESSTWKMTIFFGLISFVTSSILQILFGYFCSKYRNRYNWTDMLIGHQQIKVRPLAVVNDAEYSFLQTKPHAEVMRKYFILKESDIRERVMPVVPSYSTSSPMNELCEQIAMRIQKS